MTSAVGAAASAATTGFERAGGFVARGFVARVVVGAAFFVVVRLAAGLRGAVFAAVLRGVLAGGACDTSSSALVLACSASSSAAAAATFAAAALTAAAFAAAAFAAVVFAAVLVAAARVAAVFAAAVFAAVVRAAAVFAATALASPDFAAAAASVTVLAAALLVLEDAVLADAVFDFAVALFSGDRFAEPSAEVAVTSSGRSERSSGEAVTVLRYQRRRTFSGSNETITQSRHRAVLDLCVRCVLDHEMATAAPRPGGSQGASLT